MLPKELFSIGERIKLLRENSGMTQVEIARLFNLSRSAVNYWEMGLSVPSTKNIIELAKLFHVSTDYILGIDSDTSMISVNGLNERQVDAICRIINCFREDNEKSADK